MLYGKVSSQRYGGRQANPASDHGGAPFKLNNIALFLDVDGTLLELAATPNEVLVPPDTLKLLRALVLRTEGALALVSGRSIGNLDTMFEPLMLPAAGLHGFERRDGQSGYHRQTLPAGEALEHARRMILEAMEPHPQLLLEDKHFALALHYRTAPHLENKVESMINAIAHAVGSELTVQPGRMVMELRPRGARKSHAIAEFMREPPFAGHLPIMIGDDLTDECAFEWVNAAGGLSIAVNVQRDSSAAMHLAGVAQVHAWLNGLLVEPEHA